MTPDINNIPLRARKRARTRIALVEALVERLAERPLDEISAQELADSAEVSVATFFNYFPSKTDLLVHFIQLWSLRVSATARDVESESQSVRESIEALFVSTAEDTARGPNVMMEIIAHQARGFPHAELSPLEPAERLLFMPDDQDALTLSDRGLGEILAERVRTAIASGELPSNTSADTLVLGLASVFFGVPMMLARTSPEAIAPMYRAQIALLWAGALAKGESS